MQPPTVEWIREEAKSALKVVNKHRERLRKLWDDTRPMTRNCRHANRRVEVAEAVRRPSLVLGERWSALRLTQNLNSRRHLCEQAQTKS